MTNNNFSIPFSIAPRTAIPLEPETNLCVDRGLLLSSYLLQPNRIIVFIQLIYPKKITLLAILEISYIWSDIKPFLLFYCAEEESDPHELALGVFETTAVYHSATPKVP